MEDVSYIFSTFIVIFLYALGFKPRSWPW